MKKSSVFLVPLFLTASFTAGAVTVDIQFSSSLTNETNWSYTSKTKTTLDGKLYISSKDDIAVVSPTFDFAVTSVTVVARHTNSTAERKLLYVFPVINGNIADDETLWRNITPDGNAQSEVSSSWTKKDRVRTIGFMAKTGSEGNIYLLSAKISGIPIPSPPENLQFQRIGGNQISIKWQNPENATGSRIRVYRSTWHPENYETVRLYDFNGDEYKNDNDHKEITENLLIESYPDFEGSTLIYLPTNSVGQIQISNRDSKGVLKHTGFENCGQLSIDMTVKKYFNSGNKEKDCDTMSVGYENPKGTTNEFARITLDNDFKRHVIPLENFPARTPILFNATGNKTKHRVIIDEIRFVENYSPACEKPVLLQELNTAESKIKILNLEKNSDYTITVTAVDADGEESEPAELHARTTSQNDTGFKIRVQ